MVVDRKKTGDTPNSVLANLLNTLEGIDEIKDVVSIFTTNHLKNFDSAFVRPGRIDRVMTYNLPTEENIIEFLKIYLPEFDEAIRNEVFAELKAKDGDISYAMLKGICDDINIFKFNNMTIDVKKIVIEKLTGALRGDTPKVTKDYVL
jgi:SpoVK/Ycf46/Vps4 family AAA+-type ATPase